VYTCTACVGELGVEAEVALEEACGKEVVVVCQPCADKCGNDAGAERNLAARINATRGKRRAAAPDPDPDPDARVHHAHSASLQPGKRPRNSKQPDHDLPTRPRREPRRGRSGGATAAAGEAGKDPKGTSRGKAELASKPKRIRAEAQQCDGLPLQKPSRRGTKMPAMERRVCYQFGSGRHFKIPRGTAVPGKICTTCKALCVGNANGGLPGE